jgi:2'-5' RNA ligase
MRAFVAIELSENIRSALTQAQSHLKHSGIDAKWVAKDNIHLTLKFLGDMADERLAEVKTSIDRVASSFKPFELTIKGMGAFPETGFPEIIWAGIGKGAKESADIAKKVDIELSKLGFKPETRLFTAHVTIGRVRATGNKKAYKNKAPSANKSDFSVDAPQIVTFITLFRSKLTSDGPVYTKIHEAGLG